jgi:NADH-quinone oxidoreductase subunit M
MENSWILPLMILIPIVGAAWIGLVGPRQRCVTAKLALVISSLAFLASLWMLKLFLAGGVDASFKLQFQCDFLPQLGSSMHFGVDGISLWLILLTNLLTPLAILGSFSAISKSIRTYYSLLLLLQAGMTGVFLSLDLLWFYMFFEFTLVPLFLIVGIWGGPQRTYAAFKLFIYTMLGGVLTFAGVLVIAWYYANYRNDGVWTFSLPELYNVGLPQSWQMWLFFAMFAGFAVKVPLFPFHTWLPLAHTEAPTAGSVILAGVLLKLGTYGFFRISLPILDIASRQMAVLIGMLSLVGIIYAALAAWVQTDIKKLVAYSSVSHLGFCMLGMFAFNHAGLSGSLLYMINHGISTGALFLIVGMVYERYHTREFAQLGGLSQKMPLMAFFLIYFSFSSIGLPGLNGFVSEFVILYSVFTSGDGVTGPLGPTYAIIAATGVILSAIYMLYMCQRVLFGPLVEPAVEHHEDDEKLPTDLSKREWGLLVPLAVLALVLGVYPKMYFASTDPAIDKLNQRINGRFMASNPSEKRERSAKASSRLSCCPADLSMSRANAFLKAPASPFKAATVREGTEGDRTIGIPLLTCGALNESKEPCQDEVATLAKQEKQ